MFTQKHYIALAKLIKESKDEYMLEMWTYDKLLTFFKEDNNNFDKQKFLKACFGE